MRLTVLGGCGAFPTADQACSGYVVEHDGFRLLIDPGYATLPRLLATPAAEAVDAVLLSHGHPDHCADLNPLLRARMMRDDPLKALALFSLPGAADPVLSLDRPGMLSEAYLLHEFRPGSHMQIGPFGVESRLLPHMVPNAGFRISAGHTSFSYTGDSGASAVFVELASSTDLMLAEATFVDDVPGHSAGYLSSARIAGEQATQAGVERLILTHLMPGTDPAEAMRAARSRYHGWLATADYGLTLDLA